MEALNSVACVLIPRVCWATQDASFPERTILVISLSYYEQRSESRTTQDHRNRLMNSSALHVDQDERLRMPQTCACPSMCMMGGLPRP